VEATLDRFLARWSRKEKSLAKSRGNGLPSCHIWGI